MNNNANDRSGEHSKGGRRWMRILFTASLAFNLVILGLAGGAFWKWRHGGHWGMRGLGGPISIYLRTLPDERRAEIQKSIRPLYSDMRPLWKNIHAARDQVAEVVKADEFDREKFIAAMENMRATEFKARSALTPVLAELAGKLTAAERRNFLKSHRRRHKWRRHRQRHMAPFGEDRDSGDKRQQNPGG